METYRLFINGQFESSQSTNTVDVMDPSSMQRLAVVPDAGKADVDRAVGAARAAFEGNWRDVPARERGRILMRLAETLRGRADELAILETRNTGKPLVEAESDIEDAATCFEYYGGLASTLRGDVMLLRTALALAVREPVGVAAQIIPWNYPLVMAAWKIAPAICAGCTVVLNPPRKRAIGPRIRAGLREAGVPPGVINIVTRRGLSTGARWSRNIPAWTRIAFTAARRIRTRGDDGVGADLKRVTLELGGKSPAIIFADAEFEPNRFAARCSASSNQGESLLRHEPHPRRTLHLSARRRGAGRTREDTFSSAGASIRDTRMGPGQRRALRARPAISGYRQTRRPAGARRQSRPGGALDAGWFVEPNHLLRRRSGRRHRAGRSSVRSRVSAGDRGEEDAAPGKTPVFERSRLGLDATSSACCGSSSACAPIIW